MRVQDTKLNTCGRWREPEVVPVGLEMPPDLRRFATHCASQSINKLLNWIVWHIGGNKLDDVQTNFKTNRQPSVMRLSKGELQRCGHVG